MESTEPPRKRLRTSEDADDVAVTGGGKKARGRPRVDTQDATAADVSVDPLEAWCLPSSLLSISRTCATQNRKTDAMTASKNANSSRSTRISATQRDHNIVTQAAEYPFTFCHR